jgi:hypothetical protein
LPQPQPQSSSQPTPKQRHQQVVTAWKGTKKSNWHRKRVRR